MLLYDSAGKTDRCPISGGNEMLEANLVYLLLRQI